MKNRYGVLVKSLKQPSQHNRTYALHSVQYEESVLTRDTLNRLGHKQNRKIYLLANAKQK